MDVLWFKAQQRRAGVTAEQIAQKMGRTRANVSHILNGRQRMSLDWAKAFADVLEVPLATVLERAGIADAPTAQQMQPGFAESDAAPWVPGPGLAEGARMKAIAEAHGLRPGIDLWRVKSTAMLLGGYLPGDYMLVDMHQAEKAKPGDAVVAQVYNRDNAVTVLRRFEPPVLVAASAVPADARVHVVDGVNVVVRGKVTASWRVG